MGPVAMSLDAYAAYHRERAVLWERQALLKARVCAGDADVGARFMAWAAATVYRPGIGRARCARHPRHEVPDRPRAARPRCGGVHAQRQARTRRHPRDRVRVQALQLLYGGDGSVAARAHSLKALFRLTSAATSRRISAGGSPRVVHLRTVEHRLQIVHEFQTHTLPDDPLELGRLARRVGIEPRRAWRRSGSPPRHRAVTRGRPSRLPGVLRRAADAGAGPAAAAQPHGADGHGLQ